MLDRTNPSLPRTFAAIATSCALVLGVAQAQDNPVKLDVPYVQTPDAVVDRMLELAQVAESDYVIDLGSGDGRIPIAAARKYGARGFGVDIDPARVTEANENAQQAGVTDKVEFREQDLFDTDISDASVLTMYLLARINLELRPRILDELRPGTRVVSHAFDMGDWTPDRHENVANSDVYLWIVPAKAEGSWNVTEGDSDFTVRLTQRYQQLEGSATINGQEIQVSDARLNGEQINFTIEREGQRRLFSGRVDGDTMESIEATGATGEAGNAVPVQNWRASRQQ